MKKLVIFFTFFIISIFSFSLLAQSLFNQYTPSNSLLIAMQLKSDPIKLNFDSIIFLELNQVFLENVLNNNPDKLYVTIPLASHESSPITLNRFEVFSEHIDVMRQTSGGRVIEKYKPSLCTYRIESEVMSGVFIFSKKGVRSLINFHNQSYVIDQFTTSQTESQQVYMLYNILDGVNNTDFTCATSNLSSFSHEENPPQYRAMSNTACAEIAIDIDYYTRQTFSSYEESIDWALEMLAVASEFFLNEVNIGLKSNFAQVWELEDPYSLYVEQPQEMLSSFREYWINEDGLQNVDRHLVHLFSKRNDTGTGGIAYLNGLGSLWSGYGYSSGLTDVDDYIDLPTPYFFWNIYCLTHELGHNFGAKHTQWCGWPGGPIDNCSNIEEMAGDDCLDYVDSPSPNIGTVMSYCHTWSFENGGGIIMKFHEYVKNAILDFAALHDFHDCGGDSFGCTTETACNYDELANINDDSCIYAEDGYDCFGNCLNDLDQDGICDDFYSSIQAEEYQHISLYPNPTNKFINVRVDNLYNEAYQIDIFNQLGQRVFSQNFPLINNSVLLNVAFLPRGNYITEIMTDNLSIKRRLIIQ